MREFLRWCAQFREFEYGTISYWADVYERGDGTDMYGRKVELAQGRTFKPKG
jgi:hypothetical protein